MKHIHLLLYFRRSYKFIRQNHNESCLDMEKFINYPKFILINYFIGLFQHPFDEYSVSFSRIINKYMSYSTYYLAILNYRTTAHSLHYSASFLQKSGISNFKNQSFWSGFACLLTLRILISNS